MKTQIKCFLTLAALGLVASPLASQAIIGNIPDTRVQSFKLDPNKASFIDFTKLVNKLKMPDRDNTTMDFGRVDLEKKGPKKPGVDFRFGVPTQDGQGHTVSVEMVSLSLVSTAPIPLGPFGFPDNSRTLGFSLTENPVGPTVAMATVKFPDPGDKSKGKFDPKIPLFLKLSKKDPSDPTGNTVKSKGLSKLSLSAKGVSFEQNSPITVTAPSFCLQAAGTTGGVGASLCLAPMSAVPTASTLVLTGIGLSVLALVAALRRRRIALPWNNGGGFTHA